MNVSLIDDRNHHLFQPLLYQVATAALNPSDIATPIRRILRRQRNCTVVLADATAIDTAARQVILANAVVTYDFLIVATGARHSYFGHDEGAAHTPGLKTIVLRTLRGQPHLPFRYRDRGTLATIGRAAAIAERGRAKGAGFGAWVLWLLVHIFLLIGFRNRFLVVSEWAWTYWRNERGARLITGRSSP